MFISTEQCLRSTSSPIEFSQDKCRISVGRDPQGHLIQPPACHSTSSRHLLSLFEDLKRGGKYHIPWQSVPLQTALAINNFFQMSIQNLLTWQLINLFLLSHEQSLRYLKPTFIFLLLFLLFSGLNILSSHNLSAQGLFFSSE